MKNEKLWCENHLNSIITHVCISEDCFLPLCGKCIKSHNTFHKIENKFPEFETIEDLREICIHKIGGHIEQYKKALESGNIVANPNAWDHFSCKVVKIKNSINRIIDVFFNDLKESLMSKWNEDISLKESINEMNRVYIDLKDKSYQIQNMLSMDLMKQILTQDYDKNLFEFQKLLKNSSESYTSYVIPDDKTVERFIMEFKLSLENFFKHQKIQNILDNPSKKIFFSEYPVFNIPKNFNITQKNTIPNNPENSSSKKVSFLEHPVYDITKSFNITKKNTTPDHLVIENTNMENTKIFTPQKMKFTESSLFDVRKTFTQQKTPKVKTNSFSTNFEYEDPVSFSTPKVNQKPKKCWDFKIDVSDYFKSFLQKKYLHFFQPKSKILHLFELNDGNPTEVFYFTREMSIDFLLPRWHKSISSPNGQIYLLGGVSLDQKATKLNSFFSYSFESNTLIAKSPMKIARSSFGLVYFHNALYVIGGNIEESQTTSRCEKFLINEEKWVDIANLNLPSCNHCVCNFNDSFLYKFGGKIDDNFLNKTIEKYNPTINIWVIINYRFEDLSKEKSFKLLASSACCQLNYSQIFVFGGGEEEFNKKSNQTFLFEINEKNGKMDPIIRKINEKKICFDEGFWESNPLVNQSNLYTLQNFSNEQEKTITFLDKRRLLCFNGSFWKCLTSFS